MDADETQEATRAGLSAGSTDETLPGDPSVTSPEPPGSGGDGGIPTHIGRHRVDSKLGAGGMGVVYAAHDPELDRRLAIKLVHRVQVDGTEGSKARVRMKREAQAMAKLSHPNVITVYDVGEHDGKLYIAMEFIEGRSLKDFTHRSPAPGWEEIVDVYLQAAQGLAAAHRAGLVHRDFKPDNAMLGSDGVVRVLDFGLATPAGERTADQELPTAETKMQELQETHVTRTGAVVGTPAYMPLEQMEGRATDARSDQFSFCVALWEALYGTRPHGGDDLASLVYALTSGEISAPAREGGVPGALRKILTRGLSSNPDDRYPTMEAMIADIRALRGRKKRFALVGAAAVVALSVGGAAFAVTQQAGLCSGAREELAGVWDAPGKEKLSAGLRSTGATYADTTWSLIEPRLDAWAEQWVTVHTEACEATRVRGERSEAMLDRQMACLYQRRGRASALIEVLGSGNKEVMQDAVGAVAALPSPEACANPEKLEAEVPIPEDPRKREEVQKIRDELARVEALDLAGDHKAAGELADAMAKSAAAVGFDPVHAEALFAAGELQEVNGDFEASEKSFTEAHNLALSVGHDHIAFDAARSLIYVVGGKLNRFDDVDRWEDAAEAMLKRIGGGSLPEARFKMDLGFVREIQGKMDVAEKLAREALAIYEKELDPDDPRIGQTQANLGMALARQGKIQESRPYFEAALANAQLRGDNHPSVARALTNLSVVDFQTGQLGEARDKMERALPILEATYGPNHPQVASVLNNLGGVAYNLKDLENGLGYHQRALKIRLELLGPEHPDIASTYTNMANILQELGRMDEAMEKVTQAIEIREKALGPDHPKLASSLSNKGSMLIESEKFEEALPFLDRAIEIRENATDPNNPDLAYPLTFKGDALIALERYADAIEPLQRALKMREGTEGMDPWALESTRYQLGRALVLSKKDKKRGMSMVKSAREAMLTVENPDVGKLEAIDQWIAAHGG